MKKPAASPYFANVNRALYGGHVDPAIAEGVRYFRADDPAKVRELLVTPFLKARTRQDGTYFRRLADALEGMTRWRREWDAKLLTHCFPYDRVNLGLLGDGLPPEQRVFPTAHEALALVASPILPGDPGVDTRLRVLRRACARLGIRLKPMKVGAPRGPRR
jgi:hypothetical protein